MNIYFKRLRDFISVTEVMMDITEQEIEAHYTQIKTKWETEKEHV